MIVKRTFAAAALLAAFGTAQADLILEQPERSYELALSQVTLPSMANGGLTVKPCDSCSYSTHVLTAATGYFVNRQPLPFADFSRIAGDLRANSAAAEKAFVGVFIDVATGRVNRVTLRHPAPIGLSQ